MVVVDVGRVDDTDDPGSVETGCKDAVGEVDVTSVGDGAVGDTRSSDPVIDPADDASDDAPFCNKLDVVPFAASPSMRNCSANPRTRHSCRLSDLQFWYSPDVAFAPLFAMEFAATGKSMTEIDDGGAMVDVDSILLPLLIAVPGGAVARSCRLGRAACRVVDTDAAVAALLR